MKTKTFILTLAFLICVTCFVTLASCNISVSTTASETTAAPTPESTSSTTEATTTAEVTTAATTTAKTTTATVAKTTTAKVTTVTTTAKVTTTQTTTKKTTTTTRVTTEKPFQINKSSAELYLGETVILTASGKNSSSGVTWTSSNPAVVSVDGGKLVANGVGSATVTATSSVGARATCTVKVYAISSTAVRVVKISRNELGMVPVKVESDNKYASATVMAGYEGIYIFGSASGMSKITVYDDFGNSLVIRATVGTDLSISVTHRAFSKSGTLNAVIDCGAIPGDGIEDTAAIQIGLNRLGEAGGGTLYVPRGTYDIKLLQLRENVNLVLAGKVEDATVGYTAEVKARVDGGEFAIFRTLSKNTDMFRNQVAGSHGTTGVDNFNISGGVFDMQGMSRCILFVCSDNSSMTDCIIKDCLNDHAIQVTGSTNITLRNIMFAGYNTGTNLKTGEEVQIEAGCNGATGGNIAVFGDAEYYFSKNVLIDNCYFGPSDKYGSQTIAIGHHGYRNMSDVDGLSISNCVFDNNSIYSIKTASYSNVKILNNTFISDGDNRVTISSVSDTYNKETFIYITLSNSDVTGTPVAGGAKGTLSKACSNQGTQNIEITGNTFTMNGSKVTRRVIVADSNSYTLGARTVENMTKYVKYGSPVVSYTGYIPVRNVIYNLVIASNKIDINCTSADNAFKDNFFRFKNVVGLTMINNTIESNYSYSNSYNSTRGISVSNCIVGNEMYTRTIEMKKFSNSNIGVYLPNSSGQSIKFTASGSYKLTLKSDGNGEIILNYGDDGSITVSFVPNDGYRFAGWTKDGVAYNPSSAVTVSSAMTLVATFTR